MKKLVVAMFALFACACGPVQEDAEAPGDEALWGAWEGPRAREVAPPPDAAEAPITSQAVPTWCKVGSACGWCESSVLTCWYQMAQTRYSGTIEWREAAGQCYCVGSRNGCC